MFELQILFGNVFVPALLVIVSAIASQFTPAISRARFTPFVLAVASGIAICSAMAIRNGFAWWPEDAWQRVPIASLFVTVVAIGIAALGNRGDSTKDSASDSGSSAVGNQAESNANLNSNSSPLAIVQWFAISVAAFIAAWLVFPSGESWAELQSQRLQWCSVIALAASLAWWGIVGCHSSVATTVGFATIPLLIASAFLTSLSIMKVTEPLIAVATVLGICSLLDLRKKVRRSLPMLFAPTLFATAGFLAHANFQSYLGLPRTLYFLAMLSPAIVALAARMAQRKSTRFAVALTICLAILLAAGVAAWTYVAGDVGAEPEW